MSFCSDGMCEYFFKLFMSEFNKRRRTRKVKTDVYGSDSESETESGKTMDMAKFEEELEVESGSESEDGKSSEGVKIEAFNLKQEMDEGVFDENGNYVRKEEVSEDEEWLDDVNKEDIKKAQLAQAQQEAERKRQHKAKRDRLGGADLDEAIMAIVELTEKTESIMELLQRLNGEAKNFKKQGQSTPEKQARAQIARVMDSVEVLETRFNGVYDLTREELCRKLSSSAVYERKRKRDDETDSLEEQVPLWEYRWLGDTEIHGPFDSETMEAWRESYFSENPIEFRKGDEPFRLLDSSTRFL
ncbi:hypothetical protein OGAPHI_007373 [Ogataea philodendri]|uniref:GYF domain-containing protein n=1 Tax=Ogataea philodendri TaxID=1378263 RepID=A0A9P8SYY3_9ASCO|nr:uncharacterized protein OGAPHI_007373 [Ogataea philodendri]KAH3660168.1 hypothetical protein OGAPHI_007373 [Ogataea philodendri]